MIYFPEKLNLPGLKLSQVEETLWREGFKSGLGREPCHQPFSDPQSKMEGSLGCLLHREMETAFVRHGVATDERLIITDILRRERWLLRT